MALNVTDKATEVVTNVESLTARTLRNTGAHPVTLSRDSGLGAGAGFDVAATKEVVVWIAPGESIWAICGAGFSATLEVI